MGGSGLDDAHFASGGDNADAFSSPTSFGGDIGHSSSGGLGGGADSSAGSQANVQQFLQQAAAEEQQRALIQGMLLGLSVESFEKCVQGKPGTELSSSEKNCISSTVFKYLDTQRFLTGRMLQQSERQSQQHQHM